VEFINSVTYSCQVKQGRPVLPQKNILTADEGK